LADTFEKVTLHHERTTVLRETPEGQFADMIGVLLNFATHGWRLSARNPSAFLFQRMRR
jgi:hypothetical protein